MVVQVLDHAKTQEPFVVGHLGDAATRPEERTLKTTRSLPLMLALASWTLMCCGDRHEALAATWNQPSSGPLASPNVPASPGTSSRRAAKALMSWRTLIRDEA